MHGDRLVQHRLERHALAVGAVIVGIQLADTHERKRLHTVQMDAVAALGQIVLGQIDVGIEHAHILHELIHAMLRISASVTGTSMPPILSTI